MPATMEFTPRLMPATQAAHYIGVPVDLLPYLKLQRRVLGEALLYHVADMSSVDDDDIAAAEAERSMDLLFGVTKPAPYAKTFDPNGTMSFARRPIPLSLRRSVYERDGRKCRYCLTTTGPFHLDHVWPVSRGGMNTLENVVVACAPCNLSKKDKTPEEWRGESNG